MVMLVCGTVSATVYTTENFESDTTGANPSSGWYTYAEDGDFTTDDVSIGDAYSDTKSFYVNDSANDLMSYANFTFNTVTYYDTFYFRFKIPRGGWHTLLNVSFVDSSGQILGHISIKNHTENNVDFYFNNSASGIMTQSIDTGFWYRALIDFNLTTDRIGCYLYNESNSGVLLSSGWGDMEDGAGSYTDVAGLRFSADSGKTSMYIDDFSLAYTYINPNQASIDVTVMAIGAIFAVAILMSIITVAFSGNVTPESLIMLAVVCIIGVIALMVVAGLA